MLSHEHRNVAQGVGAHDFLITAVGPGLGVQGLKAVEVGQAARGESGEARGQE